MNHLSQRIRVLFTSERKRFFVCLLTGLIVSVSTSFAQLSIHSKNQTVREIMKEIEKKSNYKFFYNAKLAVLDEKTSVNVENQPVESVLKQLFAKTSIAWQIKEGNVIVLTSKKTADMNVSAEEKRITGKVVDPAGEPIIGANVILEGSNTGTITDVNGNFTLNVPENGTLKFTYIGYNDQFIPIKGKTQFNIKMSDKAEALDEVVVVGYGTQKKVNLTGSVSSVSTEQLTNRHVGQTSLALQGLIPGVAIVQRSGQPGADGGQLSIRGKTTLGNNDALVLVDGVEMDLNNVDPSLIESISVLKDAASAAIYGSRAANGVILITTKRANVDKFNVTYNGYVGWQKPIELPDKVGALDHMLLLNEANVNVGRSPVYSEEQIAEYQKGMITDRYRYPDTDWYGESLKKSGLMQNHFVTLSGGSKRIRSMASLGYMDQNGIMANSDFKRYTFRMNTDMDITSNFSARIDALVTSSDVHSPTNLSDLFNWIVRIPANEKAWTSDGKYGEGWNGNNPVAIINDGGMLKTKKPSAMLNLALTYKPVEFLTLQATYSPHFYENHSSTFIKSVQTYKYDGTPSYVSPQMSSLTEVTDRNMRNTLMASASFDKTFGIHSVKAMVGYQQDDFRNKTHSGYRENYAFPDYPVLNGGGALNQKAYGTETEWALQSVFGRINYLLKDRYLFEANIRYDGSSRFVDGNKWGVFPSFSAGWRISEEEFWTPIRSVVDNFKIRASWGQLGNQNIGNNYPFASNVDLDLYYAFDGEIASGAGITRLANRRVSWETTTASNVGLDFTMFNKLNVTFDYYKKVTKDILLQLNVPLIIGMVAPQQNAGKVQNKGWELGLSYNDNIGDFNYRASFNLSDVKNKIIDLKGINETGLIVNREGEEMSSIYGYKAIGYIQPEDYDADGKYTGAKQFGNYGPGDIKYLDLNGDNEITSADKMILGSTLPRFIYGLSLAGSYKGFDLSLLFQGVGKANGYIEGHGIQPFFEGGTVQEQHKNRWTSENRNAAFPRLTFNETNNFEYSSFWMKDAAYLRMKNIQLGYSLSKHLLKKTPLSLVRLYVSADNLFTISDFWKGFDVEAPVGNGGYYPQLKTICIGVDVKF